MYVSNYSCLVCFTRNHRSKTRALTPIFHELVYVVKNALMLANLAELPLVQHHATLICQQQQHLYFRYLLTPSLSPIHHHQFRSSNCNSSTYMTVCHKDKLLVSQQGCFSVDPKHVNNIQKLVKPNFCSDDVLCLLPSCSNSAKGWFNCGFNHTLEGDDIGKEQRG